MFFFLRNGGGAVYLVGPMRFTFRLLIVFLFPIAAVFAQEQPAATPTPEAIPAPAASPEASPVVAASPQATPASNAPDIIPMEGQPPASGAPLDTTDLAPQDQAMPDEAFTSPNAVIPDLAPPAMPTAAESAEEKARQQSIKYKEIRTQIEKDPKLVSLKDQADNAKSDEARRAAFREYYRMLFRKIATADKSLADFCKRREDAYLRRLAQERLEPTIPLNPPPTPEPIN